MNNTRKMYLVPFQDGRGESDVFNESAPETSSTTEAASPAVTSKKGNSIRKYAAERQLKLVQIVLRLALYGGYDSEGRIKTSDGYKDIVPLLLYAASPGRNVKGLSDFIDLLYKANVSPDMIINSTVREELLDRIKRGGRRESPRTKTTETSTLSPINALSDATSPTTQGEKRKHDGNTEDGSNIPLPKKRWDVDDSDEDENDNNNTGKPKHD